MLEPTHWTAVIIDDNPDNLDVVCAVLSFYGAVVHTALDAEEAFQILENVTPTFILLDISMPEVSGWDVLKAVRSHPSLDSVPVIALTAHALVGDREKALAAGFDHYITKPFSMRTLIRDIQFCL
ncbi:MAG TPA: response regulator [Aggregatilineaceae bacterium]|nr:response regulator [Aggregatilineaceae bacterium]